MNRLKLAELTSGVGALVLGVGLGALFPRWFGAAAGVITVADLTMHAARNLAFSVLIFGELFRAFAARSTTRVFWEVGAFTNLRLLSVVGFSVSMPLAIHHNPAAQRVFEILPLSWTDCALSLVIGLVPVTAIELGKLLTRTGPGRRHLTEEGV